MRRALIGIAGILLIAGLPCDVSAACLTTVSVAQSGAPTCGASIQGCINAMPPNLTGDYCITILDSAVYNEFIVVRNINTNGFRIHIGTITAGARPTISAAGGAEPAFDIANASVTLEGVNINVIGARPYGIRASSGSVVITSVSVSGGSIGSAAVLISSQSTVAFSSIAATSVHALWLLSPGGQNLVSGSTITSASGPAALQVFGGANTVTKSYIANVSGHGAHFDGGVTDNYISQSTLTTNNSGNYALYLQSASSNTITESFIRNPAGTAAYLWQYASTNTIRHSTITSDSTMPALELQGASTNTIAYSYIGNTQGNAVRMFASAVSNTIRNSTLSATSPGFNALFLTTADSNTITGSFLSSLSGMAAGLSSGADYNIISQSTITSNGGGGGPAVEISFSDFNQVLDSHISNTTQVGLLLNTSARYNTIAYSTITSAGATGLEVAGASNTVLNSFIRGVSALDMHNATGTWVGESVLMATNTAGTALHMRNGSQNLYIGTSTLIAASLGRGLLLAPGNNGTVELGSVTFSGAARGIDLAGQGAGFSLIVDSITFRTLAPGATAIFFAAGDYVSTFTLVNFEDASIAVNVSGSGFSGPARITMRGDYGVRAGPDYEIDPGSRVDWPDHYPGCALTRNVGIGQQHATIQSAVNALPNSLPGHSCVVVHDAAMYPEQVTVAGFTNNGASITIRHIADSGPRPRLQPPAASLAGFQIRNASVNVVGIDVAVGESMPYGIFASSGWVSVSSVVVSTFASAAINFAGISVSSWSVVAYASVTVGAARGLYLGADAKGTQVVFSSFTNNSAAVGAIHFNGASTNTLLDVSAVNRTGSGADFTTGASYNTISQSTFTSLGAVYTGLRFAGSSSYNTATAFVARADNGHGVWFDTNGDRNNLSQCTIFSMNYYALRFSNAFGNSVSNCIITSANDSAAHFSASSSNTVTLSTVSASLVGRRAFHLTGSSSNTISFVMASNTAGGVALFEADSNYNTVTRSSFSGTTEAALALCASSGNVINGVYASAVSSHALLLNAGAHFNTVSGGTFAVNSLTVDAIHVTGASSNTFTALRAQNPSGTSMRFEAGADYNTVSLSTISSGGGGANAMYVFNAASTTISQLFGYSSGGTALRIENSPLTSVSRSSFTGGSGGFPLLRFFNTSTGSVSDTYIYDCVGGCLSLFNSAYISIARSSFSKTAFADASINVSQSSWNVLTDVYSFGNNQALGLNTLSNHNTVSLSTLASNSGTGYALQIDNASSNTVTNTRMVNPAGIAVQLANQSHWNRVLLSTASSTSGLGIAVGLSTGTLIAASYIEGSSASYVSNNAYLTTLLLNRFAAQTGCGVLTTASGNLSVTSNTIVSAGDGVCLDGGLGANGRLDVASNTVRTRGRGMRVLGQSAGVQVWASSNTFLPVPGFAETGGISVDGLSTGGTFYNNSVYYRTSGGLVGAVHTGVRVNNSAGVLMARNRINMPDMITAGSYNAVEFNTSGVDFTFNDVHAVSLGGLNSINLVFVSGAGAVQVRNNIFSSSITAVSTFTFNASVAGFVSNYNVYHSSSGQPYFRSAAISYSGIPAWFTATSQDAGSQSGHPYWASTASGAEDFHVKSSAGRCTDAPLCSAFFNDPVDSSSLDVADPAQPYDGESLPNGFHANAGSTGGTNEASRSPTGACVVTRKVCKGGGCPFTSIQAAVNSIPNPLVGYSCVFIRDTAIYDESVVVASFTLAGSSITIAVDPAYSTGAVLRPVVSGPQAILDIRVASTTVTGLEVRTFAAMNYPYGVRVTSANVTLSSVTVDDSLAQLTVAGIQLGSETTVTNASVTVNGGNTYAILSSATAWTRLTSAQMWGNGGGINPLFYMYATSSSTLIDVRAVSTGSREAAHFQGASNFTVDRATFTTGSGATALRLSTVTAATFTGIVLVNVTGDRALFADAGTSNVLIDRSSITASPTAGFSGVELRGSSIAVTNTRMNMTDSGNGVELRGTDLRLSSVTVYALGGGVFIYESTRVAISNVDMRTVNGNALRLFNTAGHTIIDSTMTTSPAVSASALHLENASSNTITRAYMYNTGTTGYGLYFQSAGSNTVTDGFISLFSGFAALYYGAASSNVVSGMRATSYSGRGIAFDSFSNGNVVDRATITAMGFGNEGVLYNNASSNTISNSLIVSTFNYGAYLSMSSNWNSISRSTIASYGTTQGGLYASNASSNTFADSYFTGSGGRGMQLAATANNNRILRSTMVSGGSGNAGLELNQANDTYIDQSVMITSGGYIAAWVTGASLRTFIERSSLRGTGGVSARAYQVDGSNFNVVERSVLTSSGDGALLQTANNRISASTVTGAAYGIYVSGTSQEVSENEVWGATAVYVNNAPDARIVSNRLTGTAVDGAGAYYAMTTNIFFASNTVTGPTGGKGLALASDNGGLIRIATNTFRAGPTYGFMTGSLSAGTTLYISSNTFLPTVGGSTSTYGLYFNGLTLGATVQNNSIYYRTTGGMAAGMITYGLYAQNTPGLVVDHNRYNNPDVLTGGGGAAGFAFFGSGGARITYNDMYSGELSNTAAYLLNFDNSPNAYVSGNIFSSSMTAAQSIIINVADVASQSGFYSDHNDIHLNASNARAGRWGGGGTLTFPGWQSTTSKDFNSISAHPVWVSTAAGSEDFHPRSAALNGRFNQAAGFGFVTDGVSSPTIDRGNPADPVGAELAPGDSRVNQGSYAQTAEASKAAPPPGCTIERTVPDVEFTIQDAVNNLGGSLAADTCIVVREPYHYASDVAITGIVTNGYRLTIMGEPGVPTIMDTNGGSFAFNIDNPSVTIKDLKIQPTLAIINAIRATGSDVHITSLSMVGPGLITGLGISISSRSIISYSTITTGGRAIELVGTGASVLYSTAVTINPVHNALNINGASSVTITNLYATAPSTVAVLGGGARGAFITGSTFTTNGFSAFQVAAASGNVISGSVMNAPFGTALRFDAGAYDNTVIFSTMTNIANGVPAVLFSGVSSNTVARSVVDSAGVAATIELRSGARLNTIAQMTLIGHSGEPVIEAVGASSNTLAQLIIANAFGYGVRLQAGSHYNSVVLSTVNVDAAVFAVPVYVVASSGTRILDSYIARGGPIGGGQAVYFSNGSNYGAVEGSTLTSNNSYAFLIDSSSRNVFARSMAVHTNGVPSLYINSGYANRVERSTVVASGNDGMYAFLSADTEVFGSYVQGDRAVVIDNSARARVDSNRLNAPSGLGRGVQVQGGSIGFSMSSNTITGSGAGAGVYIDQNNGGTIIIATNSISTGDRRARYGIFIGTQAAGTKVFIASNTIVPATVVADSLGPTYGIYLDGLRTGATIQNNDIYYRSPGSMAGSYTIGLHARASDRIVADHNRFNNPGMVTAGSHAAFMIEDAPNTDFRFNDVNVMSADGSPLTEGYGIFIQISTGIRVMNNVIAASMTVTLTSATFKVDNLSTVGSLPDFNIYFSSNNRNTLLQQYPSSSTAQEFPWGGDVDRNSISVNPHWPSVLPGSEDFHPRSHQGRYNPAIPGFVADAWTSGSVDSGDYSLAVGLEPAGENGNRINMGSYGGTAEASKTPPAPTSPVVFAVHAASITVSFTPGGATGHTVAVSSVADFSAVIVSSQSDGGSVTMLTPNAPALAANTTYFIIIAANWGDAFIDSGVSLSTPTLALLPGLPAGAAFPLVHHTSATTAWSTGGNPVGVTTYTVTLSTGLLPNAYSGNVTISSLTSTLAPAAVVQALVPNTTYFAHVAAFNHAGAITAYRFVGSSATRANTPAALGAALTFASVTDQSLSVSWGANGNPLGITSYTIVASTASDFNVFADSVVAIAAPTAGPLSPVTGLDPATTYYFQVNAINGDGERTAFVGLGSTVTLPLQIFPPVTQPVTSVTTYSVTAAWALTNNATGYSLVASTMNVAQPVDIAASSQTFGQSVTTATVSTPALTPNTTYFLFVRAHGFTANSLYAAFPATATLAALPQAAATTFTAVESTSFTVSWLSGGNPLAKTTYTVVASTASDFNAGASSVTFSTVPAAGPTATLSGLGAYATWFVQVRALGQGTQVTPYVSLSSTRTLPIFLSVPVVGVTSVSGSSMTATWGLVSGATGYTLVASTMSTYPPVDIIASSGVAGGTTLVGSVFGLTPNATHFLFVRADGPGNSSAYSIFAATATDPVSPQTVTPTFSAVGNLVMTVNWSLATNPIGRTTYTVTLSTTQGFPNNSAGNQTAQSAYASGVQALAGLTVNTTYFAFIEAWSNAGTRFGTALGSTSTLANAPTLPGTVFSGVGATSVTINWGNGGNPAVTTYTIVASTASDFNAFASSIVYTTAPAVPSATLLGLSFGTTWFFQVRAVNHNGVPTAYQGLGSTYTYLSNLIPQISDFQAGDDVWRRVDNGAYDIRFADASGLNLDRVQISVSTTPGGLGTDLVPFTNTVINLAPLDVYATPFSLPAGAFNAMLEGVTNYVTVRIYNHVPATNTLVDAFYVRKDTTAPLFTNAEAGGDAVVQIAPGRLYNLTARDTASGLDVFQYSASLTPGGDAALIGWTDIAPLSGATDYTTPWAVNFAALQSNVTNYISVRAVDMAGSTTTLNDAFKIFKDTVGPSVSISTPNVGSGFVSAVFSAGGNAAGPFGLAGAEVSVKLNPGLYWDGVSAFTSGAPVWMPATGASTWTATLGITFANGTAYQIIARSSTTYGMYSTTYATASFTLDTSTPTVGVVAPVPLSTVASLPVLSGTAADTGAGVDTIEVRFRRLSDGQYWNWFTDAWQPVPVSSVSAGPAVWSVTPSATLQANLLSGASYYVAVRASDASLPANAGDFFGVGSATFTFNDPTPPNPIGDLVAVNGPLPGDIYLTWTAQGAHGAAGITSLGQYAIFGSTNMLDAPSTSAAQVLFATSSVIPGAFQGYVEGGLSAGVTYFIRVAMANADGSWSAFSNQASTTATPAPSNSILGHVVNASTQGITAVRIDAFNTSGVLVATAFTLADGSGTYSVNGLTTGDYKIEASWTANGITTSVSIDGVAMGSVNVDFSLDINYALATLTGTLGALTASGYTGLGVAGSGYRPSAEGSRVELFQGGREVSRVSADPTGRWTIGHLLPGTYSVRAYTGAGYTEFVNVNLAEGEIHTVSFLVNPLPETAVFAFPNPARHSTTIRFETALLPLEAQIAIFDLKGSLVREIPGSQITSPSAGLYHYVWDLTNSRGQAVASGVYLFMVKVKGGTDNQLVKVVKKLAVVR